MCSQNANSLNVSRQRCFEVDRQTDRGQGVGDKRLWKRFLGRNVEVASVRIRLAVHAELLGQHRRFDVSRR